jgi:hypothetical protein
VAEHGHDISISEPICLVCGITWRELVEAPVPPPCPAPHPWPPLRVIDGGQTGGSLYEFFRTQGKTL